jgi:Tol biopolymer transport system component/DNA-binding winged helix-turn-helix (wHTH) protein
MKNGSVTARKLFVFRFEDVEVHEREFCVVKAGEVLPVEPKAFSLLLFLLRNPGRLVSKEELLDTVWRDAEVTEHSLTRTVAKLRRLLGDDIHEPRYIATVSKVGYRFVCKVETVAVGNDGGAEDALQDRLAAKADSSGEDPINGMGVDAGGSLAERDTPGEKAARTGERRGFNWWWPTAGLATAMVAALVGWYLHRRTPALRVSDYRQITRDGRRKNLVGSDGVRLYLNFYPDPQPAGQVAAAGGEIVRMPMELPGPWVIDVSRDGSTLLVIANEGASDLWSVRAVGNMKRRLVDGDINSAAWSPDGNSVAYSRPNGDVDVIRADGTGVRRLTNFPYRSGTVMMERIAWSPDAKRIRFDRNNRIWEMSSDGKGLHEFLPKWHPSAWQCCGGWTPDGRYFLYLEWSDSSYLNFPPSQIWALDERIGLPSSESPDPIQLTSGPIRWGRPISSPDGKKIYNRGVTLNGELLRWNEKAHQPQKFLGGISAEFVAFSNDGQSLAYVPFPEGGLWKADRDGKNPIRLTDPPGSPGNPSWSPDGKRILFGDTSPDGREVTYVVAADGGNAQPLLPSDKGDESDPAWSPDGRRALVCLSPANSSNFSLSFVDLASRQLTSLPGSAGMWSPRWSPDGWSIAALSVEHPALKVFDLRTHRWSELLKIAPDASLDFPAWSRDSRFIYFLRRKGDRGVYRIRVKDRRVERVVDLTDWHITGRFGFWMGLDPTDAPLLLRDIGSDDIFALSLEQK